MKIRAANTMAQLQQKLDLISNNIANVETTGYKKNRGAFSSLLTREVNNLSIGQQNEVNRVTPEAIRTGTGARLDMIQMDTRVGPIRETGRHLDIALKDARHFLHIAVQSEGETRNVLTRNGALQLGENADGSFTLVTAEGDAVLSKQEEPIVINRNFSEIQITTDGSVLVLDEQGNPIETVGQLDIIEVKRPEILERIGNDYFHLGENLNELGYDVADIINTFTAAEQENMIQPNSLESSNVHLAEEMTNLIHTQRAYQMNARSISMGDEMDGLVNQLR